MWASRRAYRGRHGRDVERAVHVRALTAAAVELGQYRHYMQKEIFEQPRAVADTLEARPTRRHRSAALRRRCASESSRDIEAVLILACGTSYHAGMVAPLLDRGARRHSLQRGDRERVPLSRFGAESENAGGRRSRNRAKRRTRSRRCSTRKALGQPHSLAICNVPESALVRQSQLRFLTRAGPEIGVASTKAFTTQLAALLLLDDDNREVARAAHCRARDASSSHALRHLPAALDARAERRTADRTAGRRRFAATSTPCSSAAASTTRSPWKVRSS